MSRIFLSHASADSSSATETADLLRRRGHRVWLALDSVPMGADYASAIEKAIHTCDSFIVILTPEAFSSPHVAREVDLAIGSGCRVLPVTMVPDLMPPDTGGWRYRLSTTQIRHCAGAEHAAEEIHELIRQEEDHLPSKPRPRERVIRGWEQTRKSARDRLGARERKKSGRRIAGPENRQDRAELIVEACGGPGNITAVDSGLLFLRVSLVDPNVVDKSALRSAGASSVLTIGNQVQAVFGTESDAVRAEVRDLLAGTADGS